MSTNVYKLDNNFHLSGDFVHTGTNADFTGTTNILGIDHSDLTSVGTNTHAQIDTHIADGTIHFLESAIDHGSIAGLADDDHTQYANLTGRTGGQTLIGGTGAGDDLTLQSTSNGTKGSVIISEVTGSTSKDTGALLVEGGAGIEENLYVGGLANITGALTAAQLNADNIRIDGNTISSTDVNGDINLTPNGSGQVLVSGDPTTALGIATKQYVDNIAAGIGPFKDPARVKTVSALPAYTQAGSGVGATLTADANGALPTIDGVTLVVNDRLLVDSDGTTSDVHNGIYTVTQVGDGSNPWILTRATDADEDSEVVAGLYVLITEGTTCEDCAYVINTDDPITVDTTAFTFSQFSGGDVTNATNVGVGGVGVFKQKAGNTLEFKNVNAGSNKVTITNDAGNNEVDVDIVEGNIVHQNLSGAGTNTHAQIDTHIADTSNPHSVTAAQVGNTTAQWNANQLQGADIDNAAPSNNNVLGYNSTTSKWEPQELNLYNTSTVGSVFDDFMGTQLLPIWQMNLQGDDSNVAQIDGLGGQIQITSNDIATDYGELQLGRGNITLAANSYLKIRAKLSHTTQSKVEIGARFDTSNDMRFEYDAAGTTVNWFAKNKLAATETSTDTAVAGTTNWTLFEIRTTSTDIKFYIDGTLVATNNTNLPSQQLKFFIRQTSNTTSLRNTKVDYAGIQTDRE